MELLKTSNFITREKDLEKASRTVKWYAFLYSLNVKKTRTQKKSDSGQLIVSVKTTLHRLHF